VKVINSLVVNGHSIRDIAGHVGADSSRTSIHRHIQNCLKTEIRRLVTTRKVENAIDVKRAFENLLEEAEEIYSSVRNSMEVDGELRFDPRAWESYVIYEDHSDCHDDGSPKQKREQLSTLLDQLSKGGIHPTASTTKVSDPRVNLRRALDQSLRILDRIAQFFVRSPAEQTFENELQSVREVVLRTSNKLGTTYEAELERFLEVYKERLRPDLWATLHMDLKD